MDSGSNEILPPQLTAVQKLVSLFIPVRILMSSSPENPTLELFYYKGQWQLGTEDATYSDGDRYTPLLVGFGAVAERLNEVKHVGVLGAGLGSAAIILEKMGLTPEISLVDVDEEVLRIARSVMPVEDSRINYICSDARLFLESGPKFDLLVVDLFKGRVVPDFVQEAAFLKECKAAIGKDGMLVLNYIANEPVKWKGFLETFRSVFPEHEVIKNGMNRVLTVKA